MSIIINRIKYKFDNTPSKMYFSKKSELPFYTKCKILKDRMSTNIDFEALIKWLKEESIDDDEYLYFDFVDPNYENQFECVCIDYYKPKLIRSIIFHYFEEKGFIIDPNPKVDDLSIYKFIRNYNQVWDIYQRFDLNIKNKRNELSISLGSSFTLISKDKISYKSTYGTVKYLSGEGNRIIKKTSLEIGGSYRLIANFQIKSEFGISNPTQRPTFKQKHETITLLFNDHIKNINQKGLSFISTGLMNVDIRDIYKVNMYENKLLFKNDKTDINPITGMRDFGIYKPSPKALDNKFIFVYENRDDANNLFKYLKNGHKNFPGLERYVGIPVTLSDIKFHYSNIINIESEYKDFENRELNQDSYDNLFAIIIGQFDKNNSDEEKTNAYYEIKNALLEKGIPSQFINQEHIRQANSFNYHLPNIAIGILAKLEGIPWRLKNNTNQDLVIGFNQVQLGNSRYIGSSVFFTNEGFLKGTHAYPSSDSETELIGHLRNSIEKYILEQGEIRRLIIHYYKPNSERETKNIEQLLYNELKLNIPYAIVEVNDSKTQADICFDSEYNMGMPESGTYVKVGRNEYLLFNNLRYEKKPLNMVTDELPIKVKIHFADANGFSHNELIGQIYEFSRLIWKGLKQRSQPATTIYAKLIAEFSSHFSGNIPNNYIVNNTPWFI